MNELMTFDQYETDWKRRHRASIPRKAKTSSAREYFWIAFWLLVAIGAAVFSAAHTIPAAEMTILKDVPNRSDLAKTVFTVVELVIFGAAAGRRDIPWLKWLMWSALAVALAGNISSSVRAVLENGGDVLNMIGGVLMSAIAPLTALAAGEILHIQLDKRAEKRAEAQKVFDKAMRDLDAKINKDYDKYLKDTNQAIEQETRSVNSVNEQPNARGYSVNSVDAYTKQMNSRAIISEYFKRHPDFMNMTLDQLNQAIEQETGVKVGRTSIHNVRDEWKQMKSANGHGEPRQG